MNWMTPKSRAKMASSLPHLLPVQPVALDADTTPAYSTRNSEPAEGSAGIQVRPSGAAFQGRQFQRRENGVSEGMGALLPDMGSNFISIRYFTATSSTSFLWRICGAFETNQYHWTLTLSKAISSFYAGKLSAP
jgi:hypothetical protein